MRQTLWVLLVSLFCLPTLLHAADNVLVVEQDYNIVNSGKGGVEAKDVRQKLYVDRDFVCIDEYAGQDRARVSETVLVDLKNRKIVNLDHDKKTVLSETFADRRQRLDDRRKHAREDIDAQPEGPQKEKMEKLYRALLDSDRKFKLEQPANDTKVIAGVTCRAVRVHADGAADYVAAEMYLHPELELPYDNAEVLYLLQIIGEKLANFLKEHKEAFAKVPMELHLELAAGGHLDTKVVSVEKLSRDRLAAVRPLGDPLTLPADYAERARKPVKIAPPENERPD
jgi:hypothetical protein